MFNFLLTLSNDNFVYYSPLLIQVRRLTRGSKTLDTLIKKAKSDKAVDESEIPPQVATGSKGNVQAESSTPANAESPDAEVPSPAPRIPQRTAPALPAKPNPSTPSQSSTKVIFYSIFLLADTVIYLFEIFSISDR